VAEVIPLLATVVPLGLAAAVHPGLFALQLLIVGQPHWWSRARAFAVGAATPLLLFGGLVFLGFSQLPLPKAGEADILGISLRTVVGVGFLVASVWLLRPHPSLQERSSDFLREKVRTGSPRDFFFLGLLMNGKSVTSYALLLPALHDIASAKAGDISQALALVLLYVLAFSTLWLPIVAVALFGARITKPLEHLSDYVTGHSFKIVGVMAVVIGLYLTGSAALLGTLFERFT